MSGIQFDFNWEAAEAARGAELRATWASFKIYVDDVPVTQLYDRSLQSTRNHIYGPLYPVAEWIAVNWWVLLNECESPARESAATYARRHNLKAAGEGFALPSLTFQPEGHSTLLSWNSCGFDHDRLRFLNSSQAYVETQTLITELRRFVESVIERLNMESVSQTVLQEEWRSINGLTPSETEFCRKIGALGLDPFEIDDGVGKEILSHVQRIPATMSDEFVRAARLNRLQAQADWVVSGLQLIATSSGHWELGDQSHFLRSRHASPWSEGYSLAQKVRQDLKLDGQPIRSFPSLCDVLGINAEAVHHQKAPDRSFDALVAPTQNGAPGFVLSKDRDDSQRFSLCRALFEFLVANESPSLVSSSLSERQKASRAFAAEFLAPSHGLREKISNTVISPDEVDDLANEFAVSPYVIEHQIENHRIAQILA